MRPDGTRVKDLPPLVAAIPYIMPKRYDAQNSVTENIDEEIIKDFIRTHRRAVLRDPAARPKVKLALLASCLGFGFMAKLFALAGQ